MSVAHRFHELTGYTEDRHWLLPAADPMIRQDFWPMSDAARPPTSKSYPSGLQRIRLPAETAASRDSSAVIGISELSWLLHWSAGVIRQRVDDSGRLIRFRAACSAGNLQPIEVYLQATALQALPDGLWYYSPEPHELVRVGAQQQREQPSFSLACHGALHGSTRSAATGTCGGMPGASLLIWNC